MKKRKEKEKPFIKIFIILFKGKTGQLNKEYYVGLKRDWNIESTPETIEVRCVGGATEAIL